MSQEVPQRLIGDAGRLRQVLFNLVGNAIKFTDHGQVRLEVRLAPNDLEEPPNQDQAAPAVDSLKLLFSVRDTGVGIPKDKQIRSLFPRLTARRPASTAARVLDSRSSSRLVQMGGGKIWVKSELGHGSAFHFHDVSSDCLRLRLRCLCPASRRSEGTHLTRAASGQCCTPERNAFTSNPCRRGQPSKSTAGGSPARKTRTSAADCA